MRPLIQFLIRYYHFFLFLLLEVLAFIFIIRNNYYQQSVIFSASNALTGSIYNTYNNVSEYFSLKKTNRILAEENALLRNMLPGSYMKTSNRVFEVNDSLYRLQYSFFSAKVINNSVNRVNNFMTLNKGSKQGVKKDMGVIASNGVVGIVHDVSDNFCTVMSLLHSKSRISAKLRKNNYVGTIVWEGGDYRLASMKDVPTHVKIAAGDTVITSGYSLIFPEGIPIGTIYYYNADQGNDFYRIRVKLFNDFNNMEYVYIINNLMKEELENLEQKEEDNE